MNVQRVNSVLLLEWYQYKWMFTASSNSRHFLNCQSSTFISFRKPFSVYCESLAIVRANIFTPFAKFSLEVNSSGLWL